MFDITYKQSPKYPVSKSKRSKFRSRAYSRYTQPNYRACNAIHVIAKGKRKSSTPNPKLRRPELFENTCHRDRVPVNLPNF